MAAMRHASVSVVVVVLFALRGAAAASSPALSALNNRCWDYLPKGGQWWKYRLCHRQSVTQFHDDGGDRLEHKLGVFARADDQSAEQTTHFYVNGSACEAPAGGGHPRRTQRHVDVLYLCCDQRVAATYVQSVVEPRACSYQLRVCTQHMCAAKNQALAVAERAARAHAATLAARAPAPAPRAAARQRRDRDRGRSGPRALSAHATGVPMTAPVRAAKAESVKRMFRHAFEGYMQYAYPEGELRPLSCTGGRFSLCEIPMVTLIDSLDTLAIMGMKAEFQEAVFTVADEMSFAIDINVSVFETNIRCLGGLLAAHAFAVDPTLRLWDGAARTYRGELLALATDLGDRLLPAFETRTGIPYGTVNLVGGVPKGETTVSSVAGAGSLTLEFCQLSTLAADTRYCAAATRAVEALYARKTPALGLVGKHIDVKSGRWEEPIAGIGSNADSFYEYLLKLHLMSGDADYWAMFTDTYARVLSHLRMGDWYVDVDIHTGQLRRRRFENLQAFWPGLQVLVGDTVPASRTLNAMYAVWREWGFIPEEADFMQWQLLGSSGGGGAKAAGEVTSARMYPLRPELVESTWLLHRATNDTTWLWAGKEFLASLKKWTKTSCGFATIGDVGTLSQIDEMPSFFLSETLKYLYLLFDEGNFIHDRDYVMSTEGHPFLPSVAYADTVKASRAAAAADGAAAVAFPPPPPPGRPCSELRSRCCAAHGWWEVARSYDTEFVDDVANAEQSHPMCSSVQQRGHDTPAATLLEERYSVKVFADGFHVENTLDNEMLSISNVGSPVVQVRNVFGAEDRVTMADAWGNTLGCRLSVTSDAPLAESLRVPLAAGTADGVACTVAAFGPTAVNRPVETVEGPLVRAGTGCAPPSDPLAYVGAVVMLERGDCLFAEKVARAEAHGAAAVVVVNTERGAFVMAGSSADEAEGDEDQDAAGAVVDADDDLTAPAVMVGRGAGLALASYYDRANRDGGHGPCRVRLVVTKTHNSDEAAGVMVSHDTVRAWSQTDWGVYLVSTAGDEWQLFVVHRED